MASVALTSFTHLSDGVQGRLRYDLSSGAPVAQFRVAKRDFPLPREHDLGEASKRVIRQFQKPNRHLKRDSAASAKIRTLTTLYNVKAARAPDSRNSAEAALLMYCPVEVWRPHRVAGGARRVPGCGRRRHLGHGRFYVHRARLWLDILNSLRAPLRAPLRAQPDLPLTAHKTLQASLVGGI